MLIKGKPIDAQTRCVHWHSELDVIAIKFKCCGEYYPCYECHEETAGHQAEQWLPSEFDQKAILCGRCNSELTIQAYLSAGHQCPTCQGAFNPKCTNHHHLYFSVD
jgi:uncharacterized CHY-type Zn-finger protein